MSITTITTSIVISGTESNTVSGDTATFPIKVSDRYNFTNGRGQGQAQHILRQALSLSTSGTTYDLTAFAYIFGTAALVAVKELYIANDTAPGTSKLIGTGVNTTVTANITLTAHGYSTSDIIEVSGCVPAAYNGTFTITKDTANTFHYTMLSDPGGSITTAGYCSKTQNLIWDGTGTTPFIGPLVLGGSSPTVSPPIGPGGHLHMVAPNSSGGWPCTTNKNLKLKASHGTVTGRLILVGIS